MESLILYNKEHSALYLGDQLIWVKPNYIVWTGGSEIWTNGTGTLEDPFLIEKPENLAYLSDIVSTSWQTVRNKVFLQTNDFDLNYLPFTPIGGRDASGNMNTTYTTTFTYNGGNKKIKNLNIKSDNSKYYGLFGVLWYANISNIKLVNVNIDPSFLSKQYVGGISGANASSVINNCHVLGNSTLYGQYVSPICSIVQQGGESTKSIITNCSTGTNVKSICSDTTTSRSAGIASYIIGYASISNCVNKGSNSCIVPTNGQCAGIVGAIGTTANVIITKSVNLGKIYNSNYAAGILSVYRFTNITYCGNAGEIIGRTFAGGITNYVYGTTPNIIDKCYNIGNIKHYDYSFGNTTYFSGIASAVLNSTTSITNSYNKGTIEPAINSACGSIVGYTQSSTLNLDNCYNNSIVIPSQTVNSSGSIIGYKSDTTTANISDVFNNVDLCDLTFVGTLNIEVSDYNKTTEEINGYGLSTYFDENIWEFNENKTPKIKLV